MRTEKIMNLTRDELIELLEKEYYVKFTMSRLSSTGFKGWYE